MNLIYAREYNNGPLIRNGPLCKTIFLAGPTPRNKEVPSWRPDFINELYELNFNGNVCIPEDKNGIFKGSYIDQVEWEHICMASADVIVFWVPRNLETMPAFTTNVEFGRYVRPYNVGGKAIYGRPDDAPKTKYLDWLYEKETGNKPYNNMQSLAEGALRFIGEN